MEDLNANNHSGVLGASNDLSSLGSINHSSFNDYGLNNHIFALNSSSDANVQFSLTNRKAAFVNEIGVFVVSDDKGTVNGITPGQQGYMEAALSQSRVIFSSLSEKATALIDFVRQLSFKAGEHLGFYLVANNTTNSVDAKIASGKTPDNVFFSLGASNSDKFDHLRVKDQGNSSFSLAWEDLKGGGDKDFNDLVLNMQLTNTPSPIGAGLQGQRQGEIIDLRSYSGEFSANFTFNSTTNSKDFIGFYKVNNTQGTVTDPLTGKTLNPGEVGYAQAAIRQSVLSLNYQQASPKMLEGGGLLIPFIIANGNIEQFLSQNINTQAGAGIQAYFPYLEANADNLEHIRLLGDNTFAFENSFNSTNPDFNDMVFKVDFTASSQQPTNPGTLAFSAASYSEVEGNSDTVNKVVAKIQRTGGSDGAVSVQVQLDDGSTATAGDDYTNNLPITVSFADQETSKDVVIPIVGDTVFEADEIIKLKLLAATGGASLGSQQTASYTIINDDNDVPRPTVSITASTTKATEAGTTSTYTISRAANDTSAALTVNLDIDGTSTVKDTDYSLSSGSISGTGTTRSVVIAAGQSSVEVILTATDDIHAEADETLKLNLAANSAYNIDLAANTATVTIAANDTVVINTADSTTDYSKQEGSLRQALLNANAFAGVDDITFDIPTTDSGYSAGMYTTTLAEALPDISDDVNIKGLGADKLAISGNDAYRVFYVNSAINATFDRLKIANGSSGLGAAIYNSGGTLAITNSTISDNKSGATGSIHNDSGILTVANSTITGNSASSGSGIFNSGTLTVTNSTISGNSATSGSGGGIYNAVGTVTVTNSTISGNSAYIPFGSGSGGGGIFTSGGTVTVTNSTISGNSASGSSSSGSGGGGIFNSGGTVTVSNSTISGNSLGSSTYKGGGIFNRPDGTFNAKNTIIAKNTASSSPDFSGTLTSQGYNLIGNNSGTTITGTTTGNILNVDPLLGSLQDNGGSTYTMALLNNSSRAINAGDPNFAAPPNTDQRGTDRVQNGRIDIGAYESNLTPRPQH